MKREQLVTYADKRDAVGPSHDGVRNNDHRFVESRGNRHFGYEPYHSITIKEFIDIGKNADKGKELTVRAEFFLDHKSKGEVDFSRTRKIDLVKARTAGGPGMSNLMVGLELAASRRYGNHCAYTLIEDQ